MNTQDTNISGSLDISQIVSSYDTEEKEDRIIKNDSQSSLRSSSTYESAESVLDTTDNDNDNDNDNSNVDDDSVTPKQVEEELFKAVSDNNRSSLLDVLKNYKTSIVLQVLLTFSYPNRPAPTSETNGSKGNVTPSINLRDRAESTSVKQPGTQNPKARFSYIGQKGQQLRPYFNFDPDILQEAHELLGTSVSPLNLMQIACMNGEEEMATDILKYIYKHTHTKQKLLLMEFLGKTWGDGNTTLHLASFQGMSDLVKFMLKCGANILKKNGRMYRPVDCADDDSTRGLFRSAMEVVRMVKVSPLPEDGLKRQTSLLRVKPAFERSNSFTSSSAKDLLQIASTVASSPLAGDSFKANTVLKDSSLLKLAQSPREKQLSQSGDLESSRPSSAPVVVGVGSKSTSESDISKASLSSAPLVLSGSGEKIASNKNKDLVVDAKLAASASKLSLMRRETSPALGSPLRPQKKARLILWEPNCLFLDYAKNGELQKMKDIVAEYASNDKQYPVSPYCLENFKLDINGHSLHTGVTALHNACAYGHIDCVKYLIEDLKANVKVRDAEGWSILHSLIAEIPDAEPPKPTPATAHTEEEKKARKKYLEMLRYLLSIKEINLEALTFDGESIFDVVKENEDTGEPDEEVIDILEQELKNRGLDAEKLRAGIIDSEQIETEPEEDDDEDELADETISKELGNLRIKNSEEIQQEVSPVKTEQNTSVGVQPAVEVKITAPPAKEQHHIQASSLGSLAATSDKPLPPPPSEKKDSYSLADKSMSAGNPRLSNPSVAATLERLRKARTSDPVPLYKTGSSPTNNPAVPRIPSVQESKETSSALTTTAESNPDVRQAGALK